MKKILLIAALFICTLSNASTVKITGTLPQLSSILQDLKALDERFTIDRVEMTVEQDRETRSYSFVEETELDYDRAIESTLTTFGEDPACTMTLTLTVTVTVEGNAGVVGGSITASATGSITVSCAEAIAAGKRLRASLVAIAKG